MIILSLWIFLFSNLGKLLKVRCWIFAIDYLFLHFPSLSFNSIFWRFPHLHLSTEYFIFQSAFLFFYSSLFTPLHYFTYAKYTHLFEDTDYIFLKVSSFPDSSTFLFTFSVYLFVSVSSCWRLLSVDCCGSVFISKNDILKKGDWNLCTCSKFAVRQYGDQLFLFISFFSSGILLSQYLQKLLWSV